MDLGDTTAIVCAGISMVMGAFLNSLNHSYFLRHIVVGESMGNAIGSITVEKIGKCQFCLFVCLFVCCLFVYFRIVSSEICTGYPNLSSG